MKMLTNFSLSARHIVLSGLLLICAFSSVALMHYVMNREDEKQKRQYIPVAKVLKLIIYPIKSLPGIEINRAIVTKSGLKFGPFKDRSWMLVDSESRFITQRNEGSLALLKVSFNDNELWVEGPDLPILKLKFKEKGQSQDVIVKTKVWGKPIEGIDCGKEAEEFFSKFLKKPGIKLIQHIPKLSMRTSNAEVNDKVIQLNEFPIIYQDGSGLLVINDKSVDDLNGRLPDNSKVSYRNFRPNLLITECEPFEEDKWKYVNIKDVHFTYLKPCERCVLTTVNPDTGIRDSKEPLETLRKYRLAPKELKRLYGEAPLFGINLGPENQGEICRGDQILAVHRNN